MKSSNPLSKSEFNRTIHFIRRQFVWSDTYKRVLKRCQIIPGVLRCEGCLRYICRDPRAFQTLLENDNINPEEMSIEKFAVDHIKPVGTLSPNNIDEAIAKIFCEDNNLMGLCGMCHAFKTYVDIEEIKEKKRSLLERLEQGYV